ncbi:MAG: type II toxin-antitoxin system VapC family toxin [Gemmatimonadota bacterium]
MPERNLVLDTCALVWLAAGDRQLSGEARAAIDRADSVAVSAISAWEISLKSARGTLELPRPPREWFEAVLAQHRLELAALTVDILTAANELPWHHRDPADRFIIATARSMGAAVVTADRRFAPYDVAVLS